MQHSSFLAVLVLILAVTWPTTNGQYDDAEPMDDMKSDEAYDMEPNDNAIRGMKSPFKRAEESKDEDSDESSDENSDISNHNNMIKQKINKEYGKFAEMEEEKKKLAQKKEYFFLFNKRRTALENSNNPMETMDKREEESNAERMVSFDLEPKEIGKRQAVTASPDASAETSTDSSEAAASKNETMKLAQKKEYFFLFNKRRMALENSKNPMETMDKRKEESNAERMDSYDLEPKEIGKRQAVTDSPDASAETTTDSSEAAASKNETMKHMQKKEYFFLFNKRKIQERQGKIRY